MSRRTLFAVVGWCLAAAAATTIGLAALRVVGEGITGGPAGDVLTADEIARQLAAASAVPSAAAPTAVPSGSPTAVRPSSEASAAASPSTDSGAVVRQVAVTPGGTVVAECDGQLARLVSWAPAQGFVAADVDRGPDDDAEVSFEGPPGEYEVSVACVGGRPEIIWELDG
ncbi:septum formation initiator [Solwaraspora sp. WMMD406]|uniref:septum formation initiator n=1 Tax=Solwaraspora sp. WMMD406 TaxID=3016095 RepID=UPI00241727D3|nr:septum formation initiator [Solwaraspora sp. WMMD406]MDG4765375.1 septum formation initiator [Solwaraspora sp. WMMD406]